MSLRLRLILSITLVLLATLGVGSTLIYQHAVEKVDTEMRAAIAVGGRIVQNAVDDAEEVTNPRRRLELLVADFNGDRHLKASLIDVNKMMAMVSHIEPPKARAPEWLTRLLAGKPERVQVKLPPVFDGYGSIVLETDPTNEIDEVWEDARLYLGILGAFCIVVLTLTHVMVGQVLAPLKDLLAGFARIGGGDYEARVVKSGPPEFARLCGGFNDMGERLWDMDQGNRRLREELEAVREEERADLARDLHDDVSPLLFSVDVDATMIKQFAARQARDKVMERADAIRDAVGQMKMRVRTILGRLRPAVVLDLGLEAAVDNLVASWRARHPSVVFTVSMPQTSWGPNTDGMLHYVIREAVSNALRHSKPGRIDIAISERAANIIVLEVADDGGGLRAPNAHWGFGITGMRERAARLGGSLKVQDRHDAAGVVVIARIPVADAVAPRVEEYCGEAAA